MKHVRLPAYDAVDLDRLTYSNGELVNDTTGKVVRFMDGETPGGFKLATQDYVQTNAITTGNLNENLAAALEPYALTTDLEPYALTSYVDAEIAAIPIYTLPTASTNTLGGVKVDGTTILINDGVISGANQYVLPTASTTVKGGVKVDGVSITIDGNGVISGANQYVLPTASTTVKGGVKVDGTTITINPTTGVISGSNQYTLPAATSSTLGGVIVPAVGTSGLNNSSGTITLATATTTQLGGVTVPAVANSGLTNTSGAIRLATATTNQLGGVKVDGVTITINGSGVISANITGAIVFQGGWDASTNTPTLNNTSSAYNTNGFEFVCTVAGTVNFGLGNVTFAVGDNVIFDGTKWVKIPIGSSAGQTNSLLTINNSGTGSASGTTFNGSSAVTISYNSIGASPLAGSSSLTTLGTVTTGTWNGDVISPTYGGTGVNNGAYTLTITNGDKTLDQSVSSGSSPSFLGTNFTGTASGLSVGSATTAGSATSATTATTATNLAGGAANRIAYQTSSGTTSFIAAPVSANTYLQYDGTNLVYSTVGLATAATNVAGGAANRIVYNTGANTTGFITAPTVTNTYLQWNGTSFVFASVAGATGGTVTSITASTTPVNGLSLSGGTITTSGTIAITGTLSLATAPAIGSTSANTGAFTTLSASGAFTANGANVSHSLAPTGTGSVTINPATAGTINNMSIGATTRSTGAFTTLAANSTVTFTAAVGMSPANNSVTISPTGTGSVAINPATAGTIDNMSIGATTATTGRFTTITSTVATGTAPFTVASTTNVANLNASSLNGATFAAPGSIGSGTPGTGAFTSVTATTSVKTSGAGGIGYNTGAGAGGTVTQLLSRTTAVTLNKTTGAITLFSTAGQLAWLTFTVNNTTVAADDVIVVNADTATNQYIALVSNVASGSFDITFYSFGTATDAPVFKFAVIKGSSN